MGNRILYKHYQLIVVDDYVEMSKAAAEIFIDEIKKNPKAKLGLATGGTPMGMYEEIAKANKRGKISFKDITTFNLDEYVGIDENHPKSYRQYMNNKFFNKIDINLKNTYIPSGMGDVKKNAKEYDELIAASGGIDIQVLGIGENGHIAFNEPPAQNHDESYVVELTNSTIMANSRYFDKIEDVPKTAITMGIGGILKAKKIVLLASGKKKAKAIWQTFRSVPDKLVPATYLQLHNDITVIVDREAVELLKNKA